MAVSFTSEQRGRLRADSKQEIGLTLGQFLARLSPHVLREGVRLAARRDFVSSIKSIEHVLQFCDQAARRTISKTPPSLKNRYRSVALPPPH